MDRLLNNWKPERAARKAAKRRGERQRHLTRAQVRQIVFTRAKGRCERCARPVSFDVAAWKDERAQCHEDPPRSLGGDPLNPDQVRLLCRRCHFSGASGGHVGRLRRR